MAGETPVKPDRGQPDAVYTRDAVCISVADRSQLLRTENILAIMQLYGAQPQRGRNAG